MRNPIHGIRRFYQETVAELKKCTWPTWRELVESTVVVIVSVIILAAFVAALDAVFRIVINWVMVAS